MIYLFITMFLEFHHYVFGISSLCFPNFIVMKFFFITMFFRLDTDAIFFLLA